MNTCQSCELIAECQHHWVRQRVANPSLKLRDCCAEERRIFSLCEQHDEWTKFSMFSTQDQDRPLCKLDTFFFLSCEVLRIFLLAWDEKWTDDDESVVCPRRPPESRLRWTLNLHFSMSTRQYFRLENQALHMEMERTHEFLPEEFFDAPDSSDEACFRMTNCSTETLQTSIFDN